MCGCTKVDKFDFKAENALKVEEHMKRDDFIPNIEAVIGKNVLVSADKFFIRLVVDNQVCLLISKGPGIREFGTFKRGSVFKAKNYSQIVEEPPMCNIDDDNLDPAIVHLADLYDVEYESVYSDKQDEGENPEDTGEPLDSDDPIV